MQSSSVTKITPAKDPAQLMTGRQACALLQICRTTLWRYVRKGTLPPPVLVGSLKRWRLSDLQSFVENRRGANLVKLTTFGSST